MTQAYEYDEANSNHWHSRALDEPHAKVYQRALENLVDVEGKACLDIACGTGVFLGALANRGAIAVGIDNSEAMSQKAQRYLGEQGIRATIRQSVLELQYDSSQRGKVQLLKCDMFRFDGLQGFDIATLMFPYLGVDGEDTALIKRHNEEFLRTLPSTLRYNGRASKAGMAHEVFIERRELLRSRILIDGRVQDRYELGPSPLPDDFFDISPRGQGNIDLYLGILAGPNFNHIANCATTAASFRLIFKEAHQALKDQGRYIVLPYGANAKGRAYGDQRDLEFCATQFIGDNHRPHGFELQSAEFMDLSIAMADEQKEVERLEDIPQEYNLGVYLVDVKVQKDSSPAEI